MALAGIPARIIASPQISGTNIRLFLISLGDRTPHNRFRCVIRATIGIALAGTSPCRVANLHGWREPASATSRHVQLDPIDRLSQGCIDVF
jgi:hypothetical protein